MNLDSVFKMLKISVICSSIFPDLGCSKLMLDSAIHRIIHYPVVNVIHLLKNWGLHRVIAKAPCKRTQRWTNSQHCWMLHVTSVCTPCCLLLDIVGCCCAKFETSQTFSPVHSRRNIVGQQVPNVKKLGHFFFNFNSMPTTITNFTNWLVLRGAMC